MHGKRPCTSLRHMPSQKRASTSKSAQSLWDQGIQANSWHTITDGKKSHDIAQNENHVSCDRARFVSEDVTDISVERDLEQISDRAWAVEQCSTSSAADSDTQAGLLKYGLAETEKWGRMPHHVSSGGEASTSGNEASGTGEATPFGHEGSWWRCQRLLLLQHMDRLQSFLDLHEG